MKPNFRRCVSCRLVAPKEDFWRLVRAYPSGEVLLDRGMGRSAYLCREERCLLAAPKKNRLLRALKAPVPPQIYQTLWQRLSTRQDLANLTQENQTDSKSEPSQ